MIGYYSSHMTYNEAFRDLWSMFYTLNCIFFFRNLFRWTDCWHDRVLDRVDGSTPQQAEYVKGMAVRQMEDFQAYYRCPASGSTGLYCAVEWPTKTKTVGIWSEKITLSLLEMTFHFNTLLLSSVQKFWEHFFCLHFLYPNISINYQKNMRTRIFLAGTGTRVRGLNLELHILALLACIGKYSTRN